MAGVAIYEHIMLIIFEKEVGMTIEQQSMLKLEMDDALAITDPVRRTEAVQTVTLHYLYALTDCQRKTADRVKRLDAEREATMQRIKGATLLWRVLRYIAALGGGGLIYHLLTKLPNF